LRIQVGQNRRQGAFGELLSEQAGQGAFTATAFLRNEGDGPRHF